ncbi:MAG TPA: hypothetical protein VGI54_04050, partial [Solirubrobacteraceae bacterium]
TDLNGRDFGYDGSGSGNCFSGNTGATSSLSADPAVYPACPFSGENHFDADAQATLFGAAVNPEASWIRHPHQPIKGIKPLELCTTTKTGCKGFPKG